MTFNLCFDLIYVLYSQPLSVSSLGETRDLRRCVTSPPSNGVARKLASNGKLAITPDAAGMLRAGDLTASSSSSSVRFLRYLSSESDARPDDCRRAVVFIKRNGVKFHLGHDDEVHDVITNDVTATV